MKKIFKNPDTTIFTLKNTLSPGTGPMPGFYEFFYIFFMVYMYIF